MILIYVLAIVLANFTVFYFGPWFSPINSFLLIGLDLSVRDQLHEQWKERGLCLRMFSLILVSGLISYIVNPSVGKIAIASVVAFIAASLVDSLVYSRLVSRHFLMKSNVSNMGGAIVDSIVFPTIAFGLFMPEIIGLQFVAKLAGGVFWALGIWMIVKRRSVVCAF